MEMTISDILENYEFEEETLIYVDAPLAGWMRDRITGVRYAFECINIVEGLLWHWSLVPDNGDGTSYFDSKKIEQYRVWLSIVEDRRGGVPYKFTSAELQFSKVKPPQFLQQQSRKTYIS
jgi:hypothetical protein